MSGVLMLILARARRRPGRWLLPALGISVAAAFAGAVAAESTIASDQAARQVLNSLAPLERAITISWQGPATPQVERQARELFSGLGLTAGAQVVLLNPVRLDGILVRPAAVAPLSAWTSAGALPACTAARCPMLLAGGTVARATLTTDGARIEISGSTHLRSPVPLGFLPAPGQPPLLLTGDVAGLSDLPGLSGVYRTHSWAALLPVRGLHGWALGALERRLQRAQSELLTSSPQWGVSTPFAGLDAARAQADAAPRRLLLAGGGALAALALFIVLAGGGLRLEQDEEVSRLESAGARARHCVAFLVGECAWLAAGSLLIGGLSALAVSIALAGASGVPAGGVLDHSLLTTAGLAGLVGGTVAATALLALIRVRHLADVLAVAAVAALALALLRSGGGDDPLPVLLAPLGCLAGGVVVYRGAAAVLAAAERVVRRAPVLLRLSVVDLGRSPGTPALAIAFVAVSTGLGVFAVSYRATLVRGAVDQAADRVPLDAIVGPGPDFATPLQVAPLQHWQALSARGNVFPVRRTQATFISGGASVTVPALGVPASVLPQIHGWRSADGSASLSALAARLAPPGAVRTPGLTLPGGTRRLSVSVNSPQLDVSVTAYLRSPDGAVAGVGLGVAGPGRTLVSAAVTTRVVELEALELDEPSGLAATNGHQNGENPGAATQATVTISIGSVRALRADGRALLTASVRGWHGGGAATVTGARVRFATSGLAGLLRPGQPSDTQPLPVLVDPQTALAAGRGGRLELTVDEQPVTAQVIGVARRFPTLPPGAAGFVVADQVRLAAALDAGAPGQGRPDELWLAGGTGGGLRAALARAPLSQLSSSFRTDVQRQLRSAPIARAVLGVLIATAAVAAVLAVLGLLLALLGSARDRRIESDLVSQGVGPRALRRELRLRLLVAGSLGIVGGLAIGLALGRLAVATVQAALTQAAPQPPLVAVAPWGSVTLGTLGAGVVLVAVAWTGARLHRSGEAA